MAPQRARDAYVALAGMVLLAALNAWSYRLPAPAPDAPAASFSAYRARHMLRELVGDDVPHPIGSAANTRVRDVIVRRLASMGYATELQTGFLCNAHGVCATPTNIIATLPPRAAAAATAHAGNARDTILLAAHYDSVPAGPGAADDGAGVAAVLEIARINALSPRAAHPLLLLISDGEEAGLLGARLFVSRHPLAATIAAAVNLDARGTSGPSLMFETGSANGWLVQLYAHTVQRPITDSLFYTVYRALPNGTDFTELKDSGLQGFNFAFVGDVGRYHTATDTWANGDVRSLQHQGDNALAAVAALRNADFAHAQPADAVYLDLLSRTLAFWPSSLNLLATLVVTALLAWLVLRQWRTRQVTLPALGWGLLGALVTLLSGPLVVAAICGVLTYSGMLPPISSYSWIANPGWMHLVCAACAVASSALCAGWSLRRAGFWGLWLAAAILTTACAVLPAVLAPGVSFLFLLPAAAAALTGLRPVAVGGTAAACVPAWTLWFVLLPILSMLYPSLGTPAWPLMTLLLGCLGVLLLPVLSVTAPRVRSALVVAAGAAAALGVTVTLLLPTYSRDWPLRLNFEYRWDADVAQGHWLAMANSLRLPPRIAKAANFERSARARFPGGGEAAFHAAAPSRNDLAPPQLIVTSRVPGTAHDHLQLHLQSQRHAPRVWVVFPKLAQVHEMTVAPGAEPVGAASLNAASLNAAPLDAAAVHATLAELPNGDTALVILGLTQHGAELAIDLPSGLRTRAVQAELFDASYELIGGEFLTRLRGAEATSSQDGDSTVVQRTVSLNPAAGR